MAIAKQEMFSTCNANQSSNSFSVKNYLKFDWAYQKQTFETLLRFKKSQKFEIFTANEKIKICVDFLLTTKKILLCHGSKIITKSFGEWTGYNVHNSLDKISHPWPYSTSVFCRCKKANSPPMELSERRIWRLVGICPSNKLLCLKI